MFASNEWFHTSSLNLLPGPKSYKGWAFYLICLAGIVIPTIALVARQQIFPEALIWIVVSVGAFLLEMRGLRKELRQQLAVQNMHYINDPNTAVVETDRYELQIKH